MYINDCENFRIFYEIIIKYIVKLGLKRKGYLDFLRYCILYLFLLLLIFILKEIVLKLLLLFI